MPHLTAKISILYKCFPLTMLLSGYQAKLAIAGVVAASTLNHPHGWLFSPVVEGKIALPLYQFGVDKAPSARWDLLEVLDEC